MSRISRAGWPLVAAVALFGLRWLPDRWTPAAMARVRWAIGCDEVENLDRLLSHDDIEQAERGYYDNLLDTGMRSGLAAPIATSVAELRQLVLRPGLAITRNDGTTWKTNALGMRDQDYAVSKPTGTFRVAMAGDSIGLGLGVGDGLGFEPRLEEWLAGESLRRGGPKVEILNLALPGRSPGQRWDHFQKLGWPLEPDLVLFEATDADIGWDARRLAELMPRGVAWDAPIYGEALRGAGLHPGASADECRQALVPRRWELLEAAYRSIAAECRARGVPCVYILIPRVGRFPGAAPLQRLIELARASGFSAVVDLSDAFDGHDPATLAVHPSDFHPNAEGHALLARRLAETLWPLPIFDALRPSATSAEEVVDREKTRELGEL
ncbi:MAG: SGNH/GDSL hydrolase family protein [Isosphaeraceae bacterium]